MSALTSYQRLHPSKTPEKPSLQARQALSQRLLNAEGCLTMRPLIITILLLLVFGSTGFADTLRLSAAASTTDAVKALIAAYEPTSPDISFQTNFAASGTLAKQIALGAPADLYISANPKWMDYLISEQRIVPTSVRILASNALVLIGDPRSEISALTDLVNLERIAIGSPKSVPAGKYATEALKVTGLLEQLQGKLIIAKDVRQALIYAERGEADAAFVYRTDALLAKRATILLEVPKKLYNKIIYPVGLTPEGAKNPEAIAFIDFLKTTPAQSILVKFGFSP
jgi:molybdate transport system substrate-binding protein